MKSADTTYLAFKLANIANVDKGHVIAAMQGQSLLDGEGFNLPFGSIDERTKPGRHFPRRGNAPENCATKFATTLHQSVLAVRKGRGHDFGFRANRFSQFSRQAHDDGGACAENRADAHRAAV
jgi:hypothetical protein